MAHTHSVVQGDTLASIAREFGFRDWRRIWMHPDNAELRSKRGSPELLSPGDTVIVPFHEPKWVSCSTNKVHEFVIDQPVRTIALTLLRSDKTPYAGCRYRLQAGGGEFEGVVPASGLVRHTLESHESSGTLRLWYADASEPVDFEVQLAHLEPIEEPVGLLARLANLGYYQGSLDAALDEEASRLAIEAFASDHELAVDDHERLCEGVVQAHGC